MATYLVPDTIEKCKIGNTEFEIKKKIIPDDLRATRNVCVWIKKGDLMKPCRKMSTGKPLGVCIHNTNMISTPADTNPAEQYCRATYNGHMSGAVVHFYVYRDQIWQLLDIDEQGWHAGDSGKISKNLTKDGTINGNADTIAIEIIGDDKESEKYGAILAAYLLRKIGMYTYNGLYYHKYFTGKNCPEYILPHWEDFVYAVRTYFDNKDYQEGDSIIIRGTVIRTTPSKLVHIKTKTSSYLIRLDDIERG